MRRDGRVQRHEQRLRIRPLRQVRLQPVHPVGHRRRHLPALTLARGEVVPARPDRPAARHQRRVAVQHGQVARVGNGPEQPPLGGAGGEQHAQRLVRVGGQHDVVEGRGPGAAPGAQAHAVRLARDGDDRLVAVDAVGEGLRQASHVLAAAALDGAPHRPPADPQQAMVLAEADEGGDRITADVGGRRGPDRGAHRIQVVVAEGAAVAARLQVVVQRQVAAGLGVARGFPVEAQQVAQHRPEARTQQVGALGEEAVQVGAGVFQRAAVQAHREGHVRRARRHLQVAEQRAQVGIGRLVVDDEAGVHRHARAPVRRVDRVAVAADAAVRLEDLDVVAPGQQPGTGQPRDAGADDGDAQRTAVRGAGEVGREGVWAGHRRVLGFGACTRTDRIWIAGPRTDRPGAASAGRGSPAWRRRPGPAMI